MEAIHYGPTGFPPEDRTLVWQILEWQLEYLLQPDGPNAGTQWRLTPEQLRFYAWWYAIDERGRFRYRRGVLRRIKGWGKRPTRCVIRAHRVRRAVPFRRLGRE